MKGKPSYGGWYGGTSRYKAEARAYKTLKVTKVDPVLGPPEPISQEERRRRMYAGR